MGGYPAIRNPGGCLRGRGLWAATQRPTRPRTAASGGVTRRPFIRHLFGILSVFIRSRYAAYVRALSTGSGFIRAPSHPQRPEPRAGCARPIYPCEAGRGCRRNPVSAWSWENRRRINAESIPNKCRINRADRAAGPATGDGNTRPIGRISWYTKSGYSPPFRLPVTPCARRGGPMPSRVRTRTRAREGTGPSPTNDERIRAPINRISSFRHSFVRGMSHTNAVDRPDSGLFAPLPTPSGRNSAPDASDDDPTATERRPGWTGRRSTFVPGRSADQRGCRFTSTSSPVAEKMTRSQMFVTRSPMRSMLCATQSRWVARLIVEGSAIM